MLKLPSLYLVCLVIINVPLIVFNLLTLFIYLTIMPTIIISQKHVILGFG